MSALTLERPTDISEEFLWSDEDFDLIGRTNDEMPDVCERVHPTCDNVADYKVWYQPNDLVPDRECLCAVHTRLLCETCFKKLGSVNALVACAKCSAAKGHDRFKKIVYSESIR